MYLLMRYQDGSTVEALILAKGKDRMRIAVAGLPDAMELRRAGRRWLTPDQETVEFDFMMSSQDESEGAVATGAGCKVRTAAG